MKSNKSMGFALLIFSLIMASCGSSQKPLSQTRNQLPDSIQSDYYNRYLADISNINMTKEQYKKSIEKDKSFQIGMTSEKDFFDCGWKAEDPYKGRIGLIYFKLNSGNNLYVLGYFSPPVKFTSATDYEVAMEIVKKSVPFMLQSTNSTYQLQRMGNTTLKKVCTLFFENKILIDNKWEESY
jgi:hypothetical protein